MDVYTLSPLEVEALARLCRTASITGDPVRVAWDGGLKVKRGEGMWSVPYGYAEAETVPAVCGQCGLRLTPGRSMVAHLTRCDAHPEHHLAGVHVCPAHPEHERLEAL